MGELTWFKLQHWLIFTAAKSIDSLNTSKEIMNLKWCIIGYTMNVKFDGVFFQNSTHEPVQFPLNTRSVFYLLKVQTN